MIQKKQQVIDMVSAEESHILNGKHMPKELGVTRPSNILPPARLHILNLPELYHQLGTKYFSILLFSVSLTKFLAMRGLGEI